MYSVKIKSTSNRPLTSWARVAIPYSANLTNPIMACVVNGARLPAIKHKTVGNQTQIWYVNGLWNPNVVYNGSLEEATEEEQNLWREFKFSDWIEDAPFRYVPTVTVNLTDGRVIRLNSNERSGVGKISPACVEFVFEDVDQGFVYKGWQNCFSQQDHAEIKFKLNWSDRNVSSYSIDVASIFIDSNVPIHFLYAQNKGLGQPVYIPQIDTWRTRILGPQQFRDSQGIELQGWIFAQPSTYLSPDEYITGSDRLANLDAVKDGKTIFGGLGQVNGLSTDLNLNNDWLCFGRLTDVPTNSSISYSNVFTTSGMFGSRRVGTTQTPGQTGGQEDFGSDKGSFATVMHDPDWISYMQGALTDAYRFYNIFEFNGDLVSKDHHPRWNTWDMETHDATSQDFLGKVRYAVRPNGNGWRGYDNQHRSQNNIITYYALTGDQMVYSCFQAAVESDYAQVKNRAGADREIGRLFLTWAKYLRILDEPERTKILTRIHEKHQDMLNEWRGRFFQNDPARTVRVLQVARDDRSGIKDPATGLTALSWIPYQTGLMVIGYYAVARILGDASMMDICKQLAKNLVLNAFFKDPATNRWHSLNFCRYRTGLSVSSNYPANSPAPEEGLPLDPASYSLSSTEITIGDGGFFDWICPALAIGYQILDEQSLKDRCREILNYVYPNGFDTWARAEWFSCAPLPR